MFAEMLAVFNPNELTAGAAVFFWVLRILVTLFVIIGSFVLTITLLFSFPLIADYDLGVSDTIKLSAKAGWSNVGGILLLIILNVLIFFAGLFAFCIGIFFVLPLIYASTTVAYRQVFPDPGGIIQETPPAPGIYGDAFGQAR